MKIIFVGCGVLATMAFAANSGCGQHNFPLALGLPLEQINVIVNSDLSGEEKRDALAAFDIDPVTINGLLSSDRLANQFGGSLNSAIDKVLAEQMTTMTPDELQHYADATDLTTYSDEEAQVLLDFFVDERLDSLTAIAEFLDNPSTALPADVDETNLRGVFVDTDIADIQDDLP